MCLILFQKNSHPDYKLVVAANRDEFYGRPTAEADFWEDHPDLLAGRDMSKCGTWLGITKTGRFAAVTNIRRNETDTEDKKSRGDLVKDYLVGDKPAENFLHELSKEKDDYAGFNLLVGGPDVLFYLNNDEGETEQVADGAYGLSNHHLNTPWPKVVKGRSRLGEYLEKTREADPEVIFALLADAEETHENLPDTGFPREFEKKLSPAFIRIPDHDYGTRSSTVLLIDKENNVTFIERTFTDGNMENEVRHAFKINS